MNNMEDTTTNKRKEVIEIDGEEVKYVKNLLHNEDLKKIIHGANNAISKNTDNDTEETEVNKKKKKKRFLRKALSVIDAEQGNNIRVTACTHLGPEGILLLLLQFSYAGFYFYLVYEYSYYFKNMNRDSVLLFMFAFCFYIMLAFYFNGGKLQRKIILLKKLKGDQIEEIQLCDS